MSSQLTQRKSTVWRISLLASALTIATAGWFLLGESENVNAAEPKNEGVLARVGGQAITKEKVEAAAAAELTAVDRQRHEILFNTLRTQVDEQLIELEAKKRGISTTDLLNTEVTGKTAAVTDADVDAFYQERQAQIRRPKEQVADQIRQFLAQQRQEEARGALLEKLQAEYAVEYLMQPYRVTVTGDGPKKGPDGAPVTIVEFSDFECPYCSRVNPTIDQVRSTYGDKVQVVFRQFPLGMHPNAPKAAEASLCAHDQGKFWAMHDAMFADQRNLGVDKLKEKAAAIEGIVAETFNQCLDSGKYTAQVQADMQEGTRVGVSGTPAFFVNGRFLNGAVPFDNFAQIIDEELSFKGVSK